MNAKDFPRPTTRRRFLLTVSENLRCIDSYVAMKFFDTPEEAKQWVKDNYQGTDYVWGENGEWMSGFFESWRRLYVKIGPIEALE